MCGLQDALAGCKCMRAYRSRPRASSRELVVETTQALSLIMLLCQGEF